MSNGENPVDNISKALNVLRRLDESKQLPDDVRNEIVQLGDKMLLGSMRSLSTVLAAAFDRMDARAEEREKPLATPWPDFNAQLPGGGFWPGCHLLVSGTGVGKSMWALQFALHTAREGGAVIYAGLELDAFQVAMRLAAEVDGKVGWSELYTGGGAARNPETRARIREHGMAALSKLNIYLEMGDAMGWAASRMHDCVRAARNVHPTGPLLLVLDFLQLIGPEKDTRQELRERIGRAAYIAREVGARYDATVLLVSSVARENYGRVSGLAAVDAAELRLTDAEGVVSDRFVLGAEQLIGLGKESGEIEYSADSLTVALSMPKEASAPRQVVFATVKQRAGQPAWSSLLFDGHRFRRDPSQGTAVIARRDALKRDAEKKKKEKKESQKPPTDDRGNPYAINNPRDTD